VARAQFIRSANFAYPWSQRHEYYAPRTVRIILGICGLFILVLLLLPFYFQSLERQAFQNRSSTNALLLGYRIQAMNSEPARLQKGLIDSIKQLLQMRLDLYEQVDQTEYRMDALIVHLAELMPDGVVLQSLQIQPPLRSRTGRAVRGAQEPDVPPELQNTLALTLNGSARNSTLLDRFRDALMDSPLFDAITQNEQVLEEGLTFTIRARLPGSDRRLGEEGGA
jgi:Tfp pilus assembly protein PilN